MVLWPWQLTEYFFLMFFVVKIFRRKRTSCNFDITELELYRISYRLNTIQLRNILVVYITSKNVYRKKTIYHFKKNGLLFSSESITNKINTLERE